MSKVITRGKPKKVPPLKTLALNVKKEPLGVPTRKQSPIYLSEKLENLARIAANELGESHTQFTTMALVTALENVAQHKTALTDNQKEDFETVLNRAKDELVVTRVARSWNLGNPKSKIVKES